jgi:hypothetical protein
MPMNTKPAILLAKRLLLNIKQIQNNNELLETHQSSILNDAKNLGDTIQSLLTKVSEGACEIQALAKMYLVPQQLRMSATTCNATFTLKSISSMAGIVNAALSDLLQINAKNSEGFALENATTSVKKEVQVAAKSSVMKKFSLPKKQIEVLAPPLPIRNHLTEHPAIKSMIRNATLVQNDEDSLSHTPSLERELNALCFDMGTPKSEAQKDSKVLVDLKTMSSLVETQTMNQGNEILERIEQRVNSIYSTLHQNKKNGFHDVKRQEIKKQMETLSSLRQSLNCTKKIAKQMQAEFLSVLSISKTHLIREMTQALAHRVPLEEEKANSIQELSQTCSTLEEDIKNLIFLLERQSLDLSRGSRPSPSLLRHLQEKLQDLQSRYLKTQQEMESIKSDKKVEWQHHLEFILAQQTTLTTCSQTLSHLAQNMSHLQDLTSSVIPVLEWQKSHIVPIRVPSLSVLPPEEAKEVGMKRVLGELVAVTSFTVGSSLTQGTQQIIDLQRKVKVEESNVFVKELQDFIHFEKLRGVGIERVEAKRKCAFQDLFVERE